jgi:hypothetical protein
LLILRTGKKRLMEYLKTEVENLDSIESVKRRREERLFPVSDSDAFSHNSNQLLVLETGNIYLQSSNGKHWNSCTIKQLTHYCVFPPFFSMLTNLSINILYFFFVNFLLSFNVFILNQNSKKKQFLSL